MIDADRRDAFLRAILEDPEDDAPRMAMAGWLIERGDPRGEFIAVQMELARIDGAIRSAGVIDRVAAAVVLPRRGDVRRRERELLADLKVVEAAIGEFEDFDPHGNSRYPDGRCFHGGLMIDSDPFVDLNFSRGFVSHIELTLVDFEAHASALFAACPITSVRLTTRVPWLSRHGYTWFSTHGLQADESPPGDPNLPPSLYSMLLAGSGKRYCPTVTDAHAALSTACVTYGRAAANLPPLRVKECVR